MFYRPEGWMLKRGKFNHFFLIRIVLLNADRLRCVITMEKVCPRCGTRFACSLDAVMDCLCAGVALDDAQRRFIADNYDDCLCNDCLRILRGDLLLDRDQSPVCSYCKT